MIKKQLIASTSFALCQMLWSSPIVANDGSAPLVQFGPGMLESCKHFQLYCEREKGQPMGISANKKKKFVLIKQWFRKNLADVDRHCGKTAKSDFSIALYLRPLPAPSVQESVNSLIVTIQLNSDTLGPNYEQKILELQNLMRIDPKI